jgi:hypothetical protein
MENDATGASNENGEIHVETLLATVIVSDWLDPKPALTAQRADVSEVHELVKQAKVLLPM